MAKRGTKRVLEYAHLAMGFADVWAGTRVLMLVLVAGPAAAGRLRARHGGAVHATHGAPVRRRRNNPPIIPPGRPRTRAGLALPCPAAGARRKRPGGSQPRNRQLRRGQACSSRLGRITLELSTRILGRRTAPFSPFPIPHRVPRGFLPQDPSTDARLDLAGTGSCARR